MLKIVVLFDRSFYNVVHRRMGHTITLEKVVSTSKRWEFLLFVKIRTDKAR